MTDQATEAAITRITAYLDTRDADLAHIPPIGPGVIDTWPRTDNDADGQFELTATDLRTLLRHVADLELTPRCGAMTPSAFINAEPLGPCILDHGHGGMHQESSRGIPPIHGARWTDHNDPLAVEHARNAELAAERDRLSARVAELEAERDQATVATHWGVRWIDGDISTVSGEDTARSLARRFPQHGATAINREIRTHVGPWRPTTSDAGENGDRTDSLGRCRDCYGRGDDFEGGTCTSCGGTGVPTGNGENGDETRTEGAPDVQR